MKLYCINFTYFDGAEWKNITKTIKAINMFQLMRQFIKETCCINDDTTKSLWNKEKKYIYQECFKFPIVIEQ